MIVEIFTFADVVALADIPATTAREWFRLKVFLASLRNPEDGGQLAFTFADLYVLWLTWQVRKQGVPFSTCKRLAALIYETQLTKETAVAVVVAGEVKLCSKQEARQLTKRGVSALTVDLLSNANKLRRDIDEQQAQAATRAQAEAVSNN